MLQALPFACRKARDHLRHWWVILAWKEPQTKEEYVLSGHAAASTRYLRWIMTALLIAFYVSRVMYSSINGFHVISIRLAYFLRNKVLPSPFRHLEVFASQHGLLTGSKDGVEDSEVGPSVRLICEYFLWWYITRGIFYAVFASFVPLAMLDSAFSVRRLVLSWAPLAYTTCRLCYTELQPSLQQYEKKMKRLVADFKFWITNCSIFPPLSKIRC